VDERAQERLADDPGGAGREGAKEVAARGWSGVLGGTDIAAPGRSGVGGGRFEERGQDGRGDGDEPGVQRW
jgi:hypothetical protein